MTKIQEMESKDNDRYLSLGSSSIDKRPGNDKGKIGAMKR